MKCLVVVVVSYCLCWLLGFCIDDLNYVHFVFLTVKQISSLQFI